MRRISQARLNIFSNSYFVSFTATGRLRGLCRVKRFAPGKTLKSAEFTSDDLSQIRGGPAGLAPWGAMPGLPKVPAAEKIDVDENGRITGLF